MSIEEEHVGRLQEWILVEAYKDGLARLNKERATLESGPEELGGYFIHRHSIYQRYFNLRNEPHPAGEEGRGPASSYRKLRLKSAVILCESVRQLLKEGLIQFPQRGVSKENQADLLRIYATFLFLTEAGVRKAESLLSAFQRAQRQDQMEGCCAT